jgi:hypothetical protein
MTTRAGANGSAYADASGDIARNETRGAAVVLPLRQQIMRSSVQVLYQLAPVIAEVISAHCPGTRARGDFVRACVHGEWDDAEVMVEGMLAEPWHLTGYQEIRLREFLAMLQLKRGSLVSQ